MRALVRKQAIFHAAEEHHRELQSLGGVQRHHLHAVLPFLGLALAGLECGMREEGVQRRQLVASRRAHGIGVEAARGADQFVEVLDARFAAVLLVLA